MSETKVRQLQVISFAIHNPHAENVRCSVMIPDDASGMGTSYSRCPELAEWGMLDPMKDGDTRYAMTAYCKRHFVTASDAIVE